MATCQKCHTLWKWRHVFIRTFILTPHIKCPYCQHEQYWNERTSKRNRKLLLLIFSPALLGILGFISAEQVFFSIIVLWIIIILGSPLYYETSATPIREVRLWMDKQ